MEDIFDKKIISEPMTVQKTHIDTEDKIVNKIADGDTPDGLQSLTTVSMNRDFSYNQIDDMCMDSRIASVLEAYAEDVACIGDDGRVVFCDSTDSDAAKMVTHILDAYDIDKYIYSWAHSLIKYGDIYVRLYRKSETEEQSFSKTNRPINEELHEVGRTNESIEVDYFNNKVDKYSDYCEQVLNPAEMFELKKFGKTFAYIQCPLSSTQVFQPKDRSRLTYQLQYRDTNVKVFQPTSFVHGCLNQSSYRVAETISVFGDEDGTIQDTYVVNRGQSLFYNTYQTWRTLQLLENALLLNRINRSSILRLIQVEIGNIPDEETANSIVTSVKQMLQEKLSLSTKQIANLYLSDQPTINYAVMPTKGGNGAISFNEIGGNVGEDDLNDINYFKDKLYAALRVPKEYFSETSGDSAGFDAGGSIAQKSIRYGKAIMHIQNVLIQMITDLVNLKLYDRGLTKYIGKFAIKMHFPVTQEDSVNQTYQKEQIDLVLRIMDSLDDIADEKAKLTILKYLLTTVIDDSDVLMAIQGEIEEQAENTKGTEATEPNEVIMREEEEPQEENTEENEEPTGLNTEAGL